jgi:hypothetical protein
MLNFKLSRGMFGDEQQNNYLIDWEIGPENDGKKIFSTSPEKVDFISSDQSDDHSVTHLKY